MSNNIREIDPAGLLTVNKVTNKKAISAVEYIQTIGNNIDFSLPGALEKAKETLAPLFSAAKKGLQADPIKSMVLAQATHDAYFNENDRPLIERPDTFFVDPRKLTRANANELKTLLTDSGKKKVDDFLSGTFTGNGKIFITPSEILRGKAKDFLTFFGKPNGNVDELEQLIASGDTKKKIFNNQSMEWRELMNRFGVFYLYVSSMDQAEQKVDINGIQSKVVYTDARLSQEILAIQCQHQFDAVADSSIVLAALETGLINKENVGPLYYVLWSCHNDWQPKARQSYSTISEVEQEKDLSILRAHQAINNSNSEVFAPSIQAVKQILLS